MHPTTFTSAADSIPQNSTIHFILHSSTSPPGTCVLSIDMPPSKHVKQAGQTDSGQLSIQSFYRKEVVVEGEAPPPSPARPGDGFTEAELAAIDPLNRPWNPEREYEETSIEDLVPGPRAVTFMGRVVHLNTYFGHNPKQPRAAGHHVLVVKDDMAAISVYFPPLHST
jgi:hypothetical protein